MHKMSRIRIVTSEPRWNGPDGLRGIMSEAMNEPTKYAYELKQAQRILNRTLQDYVEEYNDVPNGDLIREIEKLHRVIAQKEIMLISERTIVDNVIERYNKLKHSRPVPIIIQKDGKVIQGD